MTTSTCPDCQHTASAARAAYIERHVHVLPDGRWVIAVWSERNAQWTASMSRRAAQRTGCFGVSARSLAGIAGDGCVTKYASRASAVRALGEDTCAEDLCPPHARELSDVVDTAYADD